MYRQIRKTLFLLLMLSVVACSSVDKMGSTSENLYDFDNKVNLQKAALLNIELGQSYLEHGQVSRAKKKLLHALELTPNLPEAHTSLGYFFETVGDNKLAEKHYKKALFFGKNQATFHNDYGVYLCGQGRYKEADKEFLLAIKDYNYTKTAQVYENAGLCALKAVDLTKAEDYFKFAVRYDPAQTTSMLELSELFFNRGEINKAKHHLSELRKQVEPTPRILWLAIQIARKNSDKDALASNGLLLKNLFANSPEYKLYLESQDEEFGPRGEQSS